MFRCWLSQGNKDSIIPAGQSRALYDAAPGSKRFVQIDGADHKNPELFTGEALLVEVRRLLEEVARAPSEE
jgi:hypothetical protein